MSSKVFQIKSYYHKEETILGIPFLKSCLHYPILKLKAWKSAFHKIVLSHEFVSIEYTTLALINSICTEERYD